MKQKFANIFDPDKLGDEPVHIIGCGAIGSSLATMLARCGVKHFILWDFDVVEPVNLANQQFFYKQIGMQKTVATTALIQAISPQAKVTRYERYEDQRLTGYIFIAVDSIETRKVIVKSNQDSKEIKAMFDFRMRPSEGQHYAAAPWNTKEAEIFYGHMDFTSEEAKAASPVNACGLVESIMPTVQGIVVLGVSNFINHVMNEKSERTIIFNPFTQVLY